jgi:hypothetical protein
MKRVCNNNKRQELKKSAAGEVSSRTNQFESQQYNLNYRQLKVTTTKNTAPAADSRATRGWHKGAREVYC